MRSARIKLKGRAYYHCTSRVVDRRMIMEDVEREKFYDLMRGCETFAGVNIITYAILSNHFHILLEVPQRIEVDEAEIRQRLPAIYDKSQIAQMEAQWQRWREQGLERLVEADMERFRARMYDLSEFMKTLKQRFSQWYNTREERSGTLWEDRFTSVLIEPPNYNRRQRGVGTLATVAAYIDLNPVRAGLVKDSKDYRWCGYGEAMAGRAIAQRGLARLYDSSQKRTWGEISKIYCNLLYAVGRELENIRKLMVLFLRKRLSCMSRNMANFHCWRPCTAACATSLPVASSAARVSSMKCLPSSVTVLVKNAKAGPDGLKCVIWRASTHSETCDWPRWGCLHVDEGCLPGAKGPCGRQNHTLNYV